MEKATVRAVLSSGGEESKLCHSDGLVGRALHLITHIFKEKTLWTRMSASILQERASCSDVS